MAEFKFGDQLKAEDYGYLPKRADVAASAMSSFNSNVLLGALRDDTSSIPVTFQPNLIEGATGTYTFNNKAVDVSAGINRYDRTPDEILTTVVHELNHAAADMPSSRDLAARVKAGAGQTAKDLGYSDAEVKTLWNDLDAAGLTYGAGEIAAHLVPYNYASKSGSKDGVVDFVSKHPEFSKLYAERNVNPNRAITQHVKGYPELSAFEKLLYNVFGMQTPVDIKPAKTKGNR